MKKKEQPMFCTLSGPCEPEYGAQLQNFGLWLYQLWLTVSSASVSLGSSGSESGAAPETMLASEASSASATDAAFCSHTSDKHMSQQNMRHVKRSEPFLCEEVNEHSDYQHHAQKNVPTDLNQTIKVLLTYRELQHTFKIIFQSLQLLYLYIFGNMCELIKTSVALLWDLTCTVYKYNYVSLQSTPAVIGPLFLYVLTIFLLELIVIFKWKQENTQCDTAASCLHTKRETGQRKAEREVEWRNMTRRVLKSIKTTMKRGILARQGIFLPSK